MLQKTEKNMIRSVLILNGSPSGDDSITLQTMLYIEKLHPELTFTTLNVGKRIKAYEKDFTEAMTALENAELIVFCYPVYTFLVPSQLHRFIELIKEAGIRLDGKYATQLSTSKHFYDTTAHGFIRENCGDLKLKYIPGLSADMEDLLHEQGRKDAEAFFEHVLWSIGNGTAEDFPVTRRSTKRSAATLPEETLPAVNDKRVVIVADLGGDDGSLAGMISRFRAVCMYETEVVDLREFPFAGGCLGCFRCASDGNCVYKDSFDRFLRDHIQTADATVYAFTIRDHSMGSLFKTFDDRQFCNGHRTVTMGKPVGYLVSGVLSTEGNLRTMLESRAQVGGNPLAGIAGNETNTDKAIDRMAAELGFVLSTGFRQPADFRGVGGMKIFRDLIFTMQGMMREDHRFYKAHGFYDFPQKRVGTIAGMYLVGAMMRSPALKKKIGGRMTEGMLMPYKSVLKKAGDEPKKKKEPRFTVRIRKKQ